MAEPQTLAALPTPALILDLDRIERNCAAMITRAHALGVELRPHMKTAKSAEVARLATHGQSGGITVSTLAEIAYFASRGFTDLTYAVGIAPSKLPALAELQQRYGARIALLADNVAVVAEVARKSAALGAEFALFVEVDCGAGRGGVMPQDPDLLKMAKVLDEATHLRCAGILTHAGHSYMAPDRAAIMAIAEAEAKAAVAAATRLSAAGFAVEVVSVGSTPTALAAQRLEGVTEMRPGVYTLFDLDQVALGVCTIDDIAVSVLATVIGHNRQSQRVLIDAGALALSKDLSAADHSAAIGYGLVSPPDGSTPLVGMRVAETHQEHGFIAGDMNFENIVAMLPLGSQVRILPNHACMTAAPYDRYHLVRGPDHAVLGQWDKATGWVAS